jgi:predicted sulfurtransferase
MLEGAMMTYVDDDDFDEIEADRVEDELEEDDAGRCDECGLPVKKDDALVCPACATMYHQWCVTECNRCKTSLKDADDVAAPKPGRRAAPKAAPKKRAAPKITRSR